MSKHSLLLEMIIEWVTDHPVQAIVSVVVGISATLLFAASFKNFTKRE